MWQLLGTRVEAFGPDYAAEAARWAPAPHPLPTGGQPPAATPSTKLGAVRLGLDLLAAGEREPVAGTGPAPVAVAALSPRENEVYRRLLEGLSNKAIAEDLVVSPRTVEGHVQRILAKLGLASRAEVPAWHRDHAGG